MYVVVDMAQSFPKLKVYSYQKAAPCILLPCESDLETVSRRPWPGGTCYKCVRFRSYTSSDSRKCKWRSA